jgi:hypothetical protein
MVYDMVGSSPSRERDAVRHLLKLRPTDQPTTTNTSTITSVTTDKITEATTSVPLSHFVLSDFTYENVSLHSDMLEESSQELSQPLPYRYTSLLEKAGSKQDIRSSNRKYGRTSETSPFIKDETQNTLPNKQNKGASPGFHRTENYPVYWLAPQTLRSEAVILSRIMNNAHYPVPRPFSARNVTAERPAHNRIKVFKNGPQAALPYYGFGSPSKYPQLSSYRYPNEAKNIQDIIKYLTADDSNKPSPTNKKQETIAFRVPVGNGRRIKFAGVYRTAEKKGSEESYSKPEESMEDAISSHQNKMSDSSLNGHAYIADPFHAFKPSDPSEINLLANSDFRFAPFENHIRFTANRPHETHLGVLEINPNDKYFPRPPINFGKPSTTPPSGSDTHDPVVQTYPGTYTSAIYRPFGKEPATTTPPSSTKTSKKMKPFSLMLDIYPVMEEDSAPQAISGPHRLQPRPLSRPGHGFGHHVRFPHGAHQDRLPDQVTDSESKHQMVVHLNLYPKKRKNQDFSKRYGTGTAQSICAVSSL